MPPRIRSDPRRRASARLGAAIAPPWRLSARGIKARPIPPAPRPTAGTHARRWRAGPSFPHRTTSTAPSAPRSGASTPTLRPQRRQLGTYSRAVGVEGGFPRTKGEIQVQLGCPGWPTARASPAGGADGADASVAAGQRGWRESIGARGCAGAAPVARAAFTFCISGRWAACGRIFGRIDGARPAYSAAAANAQRTARIWMSAQGRQASGVVRRRLTLAALDPALPRLSRNHGYLRSSRPTPASWQIRQGAAWTRSIQVPQHRGVRRWQAKTAAKATLGP